MGQLIACIVIGIAYSLISYWYLKHEKKKYEIHLLVVMGICLTGVSVLTYCLTGISWLKEIEYLSMIAVCFPAAWIDVIEKKIPNKIVLAGLGTQLVIMVLEVITDSSAFLIMLKSRGIALLLILVFCGISLLIIRDGIGMGDVKLFLLLALMGGIDLTLSILFFSMVVAFFMGLYELIIKRQGKKAAIPFAPAILLGVTVTIVLTILS